MYMKNSRYAIIGAGPSGLCCASVFLKYNINFRGFESAKSIGGIWNVNNKSSPVYPGCHLISSKKKTEFKKFPMSNINEDYPHHTKVYNYLLDYADHYKITKHFNLGVNVNSIKQLSNKIWEVNYNNNQKEHFSGIIIATGLYWFKNKINLPGNFSGQVLHSGEVKSYDLFKNKSSLIIGFGNSACDLACEISSYARTTNMSVRNTSYIIPKYIFGKPSDQSSVGEFLPDKFKQVLHTFTINKLFGKLNKFQLPLPENKIYENHPVINSKIKEIIGHGKINIYPEITDINKNKITFKNNKNIKADIIVLATGFNLKYPFIDKHYLNWKDNMPDLYLNMFNPKYNSLFMLGMYMSLGLGWQGKQLQAECIARYILSKSKNTKAAKKIDLLMYTRPNMTGKIHYKNRYSADLYVNKRVYLKLLKKHIKLLK